MAEISSLDTERAVYTYHNFGNGTLMKTVKLVPGSWFFHISLVRVFFNLSGQQFKIDHNYFMIIGIS